MNIHDSPYLREPDFFGGGWQPPVPIRPVSEAGTPYAPHCPRCRPPASFHCRRPDPVGPTTTAGRATSSGNLWRTRLPPLTPGAPRCWIPSDFPGGQERASHNPRPLPFTSIVGAGLAPSWPPSPLRRAGSPKSFPEEDAGGENLGLERSPADTPGDGTAGRARGAREICDGDTEPVPYAIAHLLDWGNDLLVDWRLRGTQEPPDGDEIVRYLRVPPEPLFPAPDQLPPFFPARAVKGRASRKTSPGAAADGIESMGRRAGWLLSEEIWEATALGPGQRARTPDGWRAGSRPRGVAAPAVQPPGPRRP